jgi:ribosomal protein S18 acetylase RimI-like enzyme
MVIRPAHESEADEIAALVKRAYEPWVERIGARPQPMDEDYTELVRGGAVRVAEDGELLGVVVFEEGPRHLTVENVAVAPERQGEGVGRALLDHAEVQARLDGLTELRLYTNVGMSSNINIYRHLGWEEYDRREEKGFVRVYMRKRVSAA